MDNRKMAIAMEIVNCAVDMIKYVKQLPSSRKRVFVKRNRRPMKKYLESTLMTAMHMRVVNSALQLRMIASQPRPKYPKGSTTTDFLTQNSNHEQS